MRPEGLEPAPQAGPAAPRGDVLPGAAAEPKAEWELQLEKEEEEERKKKAGDGGEPAAAATPA